MQRAQDFGVNIEKPDDVITCAAHDYIDPIIIKIKIEPMSGNIDSSNHG